MAISDYAGNIGDIKKDAKNQKADLKLSPEVSKAYTDAMTTFHSALKTIRNDMNGLENVGNVGKLGSAQRAKIVLRDAVTGLSGVQITTNQHANYADELMQAVKAAHDQLMKSG